MDYDGHYKDLFSNPALIQALAEAYLDPGLSALANWESLSLVKDTHLGNKTPYRLKQRANDLIWSVKLQDERSLYLYLMLEFQSSIDPAMVLRIGEYMFMLWRALFEQKQLDQDGKLPMIYPIVLYNGEPPWSAAVSLSELLPPVPAGISLVLPSLQYTLLDERRLASDSDAENNIAAALFALEAISTREQQMELLDSLTHLLREQRSKPLQNAFTRWLNAQFLQQSPTQRSMVISESFWESNTMTLAEKFTQFYDDAVAEGEARGEAKGEAKGQALALEQARMTQVQVCRTSLERRFGTLDPFSLQRIEQASFMRLAQWCLQVEDFESVAALLDSSSE